MKRSQLLVALSTTAIAILAGALFNLAVLAMIIILAGQGSFNLCTGFGDIPDDLLIPARIHTVPEKLPDRDAYGEERIELGTLIALRGD